MPVAVKCFGGCGEDRGHSKGGDGSDRREPAKVLQPSVLTLHAALINNKLWRPDFNFVLVHGTPNVFYHVPAHFIVAFWPGPGCDITARSTPYLRPLCEAACLAEVDGECVARMSQAEAGALQPRRQPCRLSCIVLMSAHRRAAATPIDEAAPQSSASVMLRLMPCRIHTGLHTCLRLLHNSQVWMASLRCVLQADAMYLF